MLSILVGTILPAACILADTTLDDYRWNHRILVIPVLTDPMLANLKLNEDALNERDVISIASGIPEHASLLASIQKNFGFKPDGDEILLIGKDGRTHIRWNVTSFRFEDLFRRIDAMPMRIREMKTR